MVTISRAVILLSFALLLITWYPADATEKESYSGRNYTFIAGLPPEGLTYLYQWAASDGYPLSSTDRSFNWTAPVVYTITPVVIDLIVRDKRSGCPGKREFVIYVKPTVGNESDPQSNLSVIKKAEPEAAKPGQVITYSYIITNNGYLPISGITLTDDKLGSIPINSTSLDSGRSASGQAKYTVTANDLPGPISNLAIAEGKDTQGRSINGSASASVLINPIRESSIRISKGCIFKDPVVIGDQITYTYNITNTGDLPLKDVNITDSADWGPCCTPIYHGGDDGNRLLDPSETWRYTCQYTVQDPLNYQKLTIQSDKENGDEIYRLHERLERLKIMLQFRMQKMIRMQRSFDLSKALQSTEIITINGTSYVRYNYTSRLTGSVLSRAFDATGALKTSRLSDILSEVYLTTEYGDGGRITSHTLLANKTREYQLVEYDNPYMGFKTITTIDLKTGDTYVVVIDSEGIEVDKIFKKTPGYRLYVEKIYLRNTATVTAKDALGGTVSDFDSFLLEIHRPMPALSIEKVADPTPAIIGQILNYTITYQNDGDETARSVVVKETYDKNVTFVSAYPEPDSGTLDEWSIGDLDKGSSGVIKVVVNVPLSFNTTEDVGGIDPLRRVVRNVVNISCAQGVWKKIYLNTTAIVKQVPGISLNKSYLIDNNLSRTAVRPGDSIEYFYRVNNTGNMSLKWLSLADDRLGQVSLDKTILEEDEAAFGKATYTVKESDLPGPLVNNASINGTPVSEIPGISTNVTDRASVWIPISTINITKSADKNSARVGDLVNYTYRVRNSGSSTITLTELKDIVDKNGRIIEVWPNPAGMVLQGGDVLWFNGTYKVTEDDVPGPVKNTPLVNTATVYGRDHDGMEVNASAEASVDILALKLTKTADREQIGSGQEIRYNYTVTNIGSGDVTLASLVDNKTADVDDPSGTWLQSGESASFSGVYTANASDGDAVVNSATISGADEHGTAVNATASASVKIAMKLTKSADKVSAGAGEVINYTYTIWNNGTSDITLSSLADDLVQVIVPNPAGFVIHPGESPEFHGSYYVTPSDIGRQIINYATASGIDADGRTITSQATASVNTSLIRLIKTPDRSTAAIGDIINYTYTVRNYGSTDVTIAWFDDKVSNGKGTLKALSNIGEIQTYIKNITIPGKNPYQFPVNGHYTVVAEDLDQPGPITNNATIWITDAEGNNMSASATATVMPGALTLTKTANRTAAAVGEWINYTYVVKNVGASSVTFNLTDDKAEVKPRSGTPPGPFYKLSSGNAFSFYALHKVDAPGTLVNNATVWVNGVAVAKASASVKTIEGQIGIIKTANKYIFSVGDTIHYSYVIHNYGTSNIILKSLSDNRTSVTPDPKDINVAPGQDCTTIFTSDYLIKANDTSPIVNSATVIGNVGLQEVNATAVLEVDPALMVTKTPDKTFAYLGENITYTYVVTNKESHRISLTKITDDKLSNIKPAISTSGIILEPYSSLTFTGIYTVSKSHPTGPLKNSVVVNGTVIGITPPNDIAAKADATVRIESTPISSIAIYKTAILPPGQNKAKEGDIIQYTYDVVNTGKFDITLDDLTDDYIRSLSPRPSGTTINSNKPAVFTGNYTVTSRDYSASSDPCNPTIVNKVKASGRDSSGAKVEGLSSASVSLVPASLILTKIPSKAIAKIGNEITYNYTLNNTGGITLRGVELVDDKLGKIRTGKRELAPGENTTGTARYTITISDLPGPVTNNATVTSSVPLCGGANASASVDLISLTINKTSSTELAGPGTTFYYFLTFRNNGNANATGVKVWDKLDPVLEFDPIRGSIPAPSPKEVNEADDEYEWVFPLLRPGEEKVIEMLVTVKDEIPDEKEEIINQYKIDCEPFEETLKWEKYPIKLVNHDLWVTKKADKSTYAPGSEAVYTISFGNSFNRTAYNVTLGDTLPDVEYLYSSASPTLIKGNLLLWSLGELSSNASGNITVTVRIPYRPNMTYNESSYVSGTGYAYESKHLWTGMVPQSLLNRANISGYYIDEKSGLKIWDGDNSTVRSNIVNPGTDVRVLQHGSGFLEQEEEVKLRIANRSIKLDRDTFAQHADTNFSLPGGRLIPFRSQWSDWTRTRNDVREETLSESFLYMDTVEKQSSFLLDENQTVYKSTSDFDGGIASIRFVKKKPDTKKSDFEVDDRYHGSFKIRQSLDSYGSGVAYGKSAQGGGFVASDKRPSGTTQRSFEQGSGRYESEEIIHTGTTIKDLNMSYVPNIQTAGWREIYYGSMLHEEMRTKDPDQGSSISESISYASEIDKESLMEKSNLAIFGGFNGTAEIKAEKRKILNPTHVTGSLKDRTVKGEVLVDQVLTGNFTIDTTISIRKMPKYVRPHITITKRGKRISDDMVLFKINVTNDGNKTLGPVEVIDVLPEGMTFVNASLRPKVNGSVIKWTILSLSRSKKQSIDLRVRINESDANTGFTNSARAVGTYDRVKHVDDEGSFFLILDLLPRFFASPDVYTLVENTSPEYLGGEGWGDGWKPPEEMGLCSNATYCPAIPDSECASCPDVMHLMVPDPNYK